MIQWPSAMVQSTTLWLFFIIAAGIVFGSALIMSKHLGALTHRTSINHALAGAVLLSIVTSLPELVSAVTFGVSGRVELAFSNVLGSNFLTLVALAAADIIFFRHQMFKKMSKTNRLLPIILAGINFLIMLALIPGAGMEWLRLTIPKINVSWLNILLVVVYIIVFFAVIRKDEEEVFTAHNIDQAKVALKHRSLKFIWLIFITSTLIMVASSWWLAEMADQMTTVYNINAASVGGILLSFITAMPEIVSLITLCKLGLGNVGISGVLGSHIFNYCLLFVTDAIDYKEGSLDTINNLSDHWHYFALSLFLITGLGLLVSHSFKRINQNRWVYWLNTSSLILLYIVGWIIINVVLH